MARETNKYLYLHKISRDFEGDQINYSLDHRPFWLGEEGQSVGSGEY